MNKDPRFVTLIFVNVKDTHKLLSLLKQHIAFPIVKEKEQNDGIVAVVVKGFEYGDVEKYMSAFCQHFGFKDVICSASKGNIFE